MRIAVPWRHCIGTDGCGRFAWRGAGCAGLWLGLGLESCDFVTLQGPQPLVHRGTS